MRATKEDAEVLKRVALKSGERHTGIIENELKPEQIFLFPIISHAKIHAA